MFSGVWSRGESNLAGVRATCPSFSYPPLLEGMSASTQKLSWGLLGNLRNSTTLFCILRILALSWNFIPLHCTTKNANVSIFLNLNVTSPPRITCCETSRNRCKVDVADEKHYCEIICNEFHWTTLLGEYLGNCRAPWKKSALNSEVCGNGYSNTFASQKLLQQLCSHRTVELGDNGGFKSCYT